MSDTPAGVVATSGPVRTREDNTLRLQLAIDPALAKIAFRLFGQRGTAVALALLGKPEVPAVEAASAAVETMAKGVMRLFVDVEPRNAARAFELFGEQGTLMALAALTPEHLREREREKQQRLEARGLRPAYLAVQWCNDGAFVLWLAGAYPDAFRCAQESSPDGKGSDWAADCIRQVCDLTSRGQLDTDADARSRFDRNIRRPFVAWQQAQTTT
jgi:hypothetical protein